MKTGMKLVTIALFVAAGAMIVFSGGFPSSATQTEEPQQQAGPVVTGTISGEHLNVYLGSFGNITFNAPLPESPRTIRVYKGVLDPGDLIDEDLGPFIGDGINVPSEDEAPELSLKVLENYGGLPPGAILTGASTSYAELANSTPTTGSVTLTITFNDTSTNSPTGWLWDFGDSTNATVQNPVHTFTAPGNYTVALNVTNNDGTDSITRPDYISVSDIPPITLTTQPTSTITTTVTTTTMTTKPAPTKTHASLSPVIAMIGSAVVGTSYASGKRRVQ